MFKIINKNGFSIEGFETEIEAENYINSYGGDPADWRVDRWTDAPKEFVWQARENEKK